ncbi:CE1 family esterase [Chitinimonas naiadis]
MTMNMESLLREATRLTTAGRLMDATELIQRKLQAKGSVPATFSTEADSRPPLDGSYTVVEPAPRQHGNPDKERMADAVPRTEPAGKTGEGRFLAGRFSGTAGSRNYKLYIPSGPLDQPLPLIVMLHGCTQNPDDFAVGTQMNALADAQRCYVLYPAQTSQANSSACWNWFKDSDQQRGQGEPAILAGMTQDMLARYAIDSARVYVAGLSAGGAMAMIMGATYPDIYAAVGVHSGLPYAAAKDLPSALAAMQGLAAMAGLQKTEPARVNTLPTIVFHGDRDTTVHPANGDRVVAQARPASADIGGAAQPSRPDHIRRGQVPAGHRYTVSSYHDARQQAVMEHWLVHGAGHAWSGGNRRGSYTDPKGPDASAEMLRFFLAQTRRHG